MVLEERRTYRVEMRQLRQAKDRPEGGPVCLECLDPVSGETFYSLDGRHWMCANCLLSLIVEKQMEVVQTEKPSG